jgi:hypothetical protein
LLWQPAGLPSAPAGCHFTLWAGFAFVLFSGGSKVCDNFLYEDQGLTHIRSDAYSRQQLTPHLNWDSFPR